MHVYICMHIQVYMYIYMDIFIYIYIYHVKVTRTSHSINTQSSTMCVCVHVSELGNSEKHVLSGALSVPMSDTPNSVRVRHSGPLKNRDMYRDKFQLSGQSRHMP